MKKLFITLLIFGLSTNLFANTFDQWKSSYVKRAAKRGIPSSFSSKILSKIKLNEEVIEKSSKQLVFNKKVNYQTFINKWLRDDQRIIEGKEMLKKHHQILEKVEREYGVDKEAIVAIWGVETLYSKIMGDYNVVEALASLAYKSKRKNFYEIQLNAALRLLAKKKVIFNDFIGSWAGASGACQFMPSNISVYGQDFDNDGIINLWSSYPDIFASIANLLKKGGWQKGKSIGSLVIPPKNIEKINLDKYRSPKGYSDLGFKTLDGKKIKSDIWTKRRAAAIPFEDSPVLLRGSNYVPILRWNRSSLFAAFNIILINEFR